jgi:hypothetical protein
MYNNSLNGFSGFGSLVSIGGCLELEGCNSLTSFTGLENLVSIGGYFRASGILTDFTGLDNLGYIGGIFMIGWQPMLENFSGLENLIYAGGLSVTYTEKLKDFTGLSNLASIGEGGFGIAYNNLLSDFTGLESLTQVTGGIGIISNPDFASFSGLYNLTSIGGLTIWGNEGLKALSGLENLVSITGDVEIVWNESLTDLSGISNIDASSIENLSIYNNLSLSSCAVQSICEYLASPNGQITIHGNDSGCNSQQEVESLCAVGVNETYPESSTINIFPNPISDKVSISLAHQPSEDAFLLIYSPEGKQILFRQITLSTTILDVSDLAPGVYFIRVIDGENVKVLKMIKG